MNHSVFIIMIYRQLLKVYNNLPQIICSDLFIGNHIAYNLSSKSDFAIPQVKIVYKGSNSLRYLRLVIWNLIPNEIKYSDSLEDFPYKIKQWKSNTSPYRQLKIFIPSVGVVESFFSETLSTVWSRCKQIEICWGSFYIVCFPLYVILLCNYSCGLVCNRE